MGVAEESLDLDTPMDQVWDLFTDPDRWLDWNTELADMRDVDGPFDTPGSGYTQVWRIAGVEREGTWQVTGCEPRQWRTVEGVTPIGLAYTARETFEQLDHGTRVTVRIAWQTPGGPLGRLFDVAAAQPMLRRALRNNSQRIRDVLAGAG